MELRADPAALAPERLLVFEVAGPVQNFAAAIRRVEGLQLVDEEELEADESVDSNPLAYLLVPDIRALAELLSLWRQWQDGRQLDRGFALWRDVFALLRALRPWGPADRVTAEDRAALAEEAAELAAAELLHVEVELVFRTGVAGNRAEATIREAIGDSGGTVIDRSRIDGIAYHALLARLPAAAVRAIAELAPGSIANIDAVMHVRPQAMSFAIETADPSPSAAVSVALSEGRPIAALLDGVPVSEHPLLAGRLRVEDLFGYEAGTQVGQRRHGTAMASLLVHGDRNRKESPLGRPVTVVPVMRWDGNDEVLPTDRLVVDLVYRAVSALRAGADPLAPDVLVVNVSLGNLRRPFHGQMSPWARLLDRLAWLYGILFVVSAGNVAERFVIGGFDGSADFEDAVLSDRAAATLRAVHALSPDRRIISPAETVNGLTIGASNEDAVDPAHRRTAAVNIDPFPGLRMANSSSRLGPGFARATKPDALMPGGREHVRAVASGGGLEVRPAGAARAFGLRVAAPGSGQAMEHYTTGSSAAAALASRTCHLIHDALERTYGSAFLGLSHSHRALCLKALFAHGAHWPRPTSDMIRATLGPWGQGQAPKQKDNVRRFLGYGMVDSL